MQSKTIMILSIDYENPYIIFNTPSKSYRFLMYCNFGKDIRDYLNQRYFQNPIYTRGDFKGQRRKAKIHYNSINFLYDIDFEDIVIEFRPGIETPHIICKENLK